MDSRHSLMIICSSETSDEQCKEMIVERMLAMFPDAMVDGAPVVQTDDNVKTCGIAFTSATYDFIAQSVLVAVLHELESAISDLERCLTQEKTREYASFIDSVYDRIRGMFPEKE